MIRDVSAFLKYFQGVRRRTIRDVAALPPEADGWRPTTGEGEGAWDIGKIVEHVAESPLFFVNAFTGRGWVWESWPEPLTSREQWVPALERGAEQLATALADAPQEWVDRRITGIGGQGEIAAWRTLFMMTEHEIAHRAQLTTYAGLNGWPVHQIFDRTNEWVVSQRDAEARRHS